MKVIIYTHAGLMHADEVGACALVKLFLNEGIEVRRVSHDVSEYPDANFVIDIGRVHDGKTRFDHHQNKGGKASTGLIWDLIGLQEDYPEISDLIEMIDANDVGEAKSNPFDIPAMVSAFNHKDIYSEDQDDQFMKAVNFMHEVFLFYKNKKDGMLVKGVPIDVNEIIGSALNNVFDSDYDEEKYTKIARVIGILNKDHDELKKRFPFGISAILKLYIDEGKNEEATSFLTTMFRSYKKEIDSYDEAKEICENSSYFAGIKDVIELTSFTPQWSKFINGDERPDIEAVVWWDDHQEKYKTQIVAKSPGSFEANGKRFLEDKTMDFVHKAGFFAVATHKQVMINFLKNSRK